MASITDKNGVKTVQVVRPDGKRMSINLGRADHSTAQVSARWLQAIVDALRYQQPIDSRVLKWLSAIPDKLHTRIVRAGLVEPRAAAAPATSLTMGYVTQAYIDRRTDIEPSSIANFEKARANLVEFFGATSSVSAITPARADDFKRWLLAKYARPTVCQRIKRTKTIFRDAVRRGLLPVSPFAEVTAGKDSNPENDAFVTRETIDRVIAATRDTAWKLVIALSRYGGLRIPSELQSLRWRDVLWDERRLVIHAKKTKKIEGKAIRVMPLFDELEPLLRQAFDEAPVGAEFVIPDRLRLHSNLGSPFRDLIARAGVAPWPRQFHNLRASRLTELLDVVSLKTVCDWLGNDPTTAMKHYMRTPAEHFTRVLAPREPTATPLAKTSAETSAAGPRIEPHGVATSIVPQDENARNARILQGGTMQCEVVQSSSEMFTGPRGT